LHAVKHVKVAVLDELAQPLLPPDQQVGFEQQHALLDQRLARGILLFL